MGYKKLDEVMELLTDELDGFNKSLERLEKLTQNTDDIQIKPDTSEIEYLFKEYLKAEKTRNSKLHESFYDLEKQISKACLIPKVQLLLQYSSWLISLVIIGYLAFHVSRIDQIQQKTFAEGEQQVIHELRGYFDQYPEHYKSYQKWIKEKDSVPNQK